MTARVSLALEGAHLDVFALEMGDAARRSGRHRRSRPYRLWRQLEQERVADSGARRHSDPRAGHDGSSNDRARRQPHHAGRGRSGRRQPCRVHRRLQLLARRPHRARGQAITLNVSNGGQFPHTFTITGVADSGTLSAGTSKPVTFTPSQAGTLTFFCMIHGQATMSGTITVSASGPLGPAPGTGGGVTTSSGAGPVPTVSGYDYGY